MKQGFTRADRLDSFNLCLMIAISIKDYRVASKEKGIKKINNGGINSYYVVHIVHLVEMSKESSADNLSSQLYLNKDEILSSLNGSDLYE